jgi:polar amino acid transport system substrate-binding protein
MTAHRPRLLVALLGVLALIASITACSSSSSGGSGTPAKSVGVAKSGVLKIGTSSNEKPYVYQENGKLTGFEIDLITAAAKKLSLKPEFVTMDFSALLPAVNNSQFDVAAAAIGITAPREKMVTFSSGYLAGFFGVLTPPTSGITKDVATVKGKKIAVLQGSIEDTNASKFIPGAQIVRFPDQNSAALALANHRVDGLFNDYDPNLSLVSKYPALKLAQPISLPASAFPAGWVVKKGNATLVGKLNDALTQVVQDGTWMTLYKKYFPRDPIPTKSQLPPYKVA